MKALPNATIYFKKNYHAFFYTSDPHHSVNGGTLGPSR
jgi:hypothetical protein